MFQHLAGPVQLHRQVLRVLCYQRPRMVALFHVDPRWPEDELGALLVQPRVNVQRWRHAVCDTTRYCLSDSGNRLTSFQKALLQRSQAQLRRTGERRTDWKLILAT
jgi:hypothetical protein